MISLQQLNTNSLTQLNFTDNRPSGVRFVWPNAEDITEEITSNVFVLKRKQDIESIIKPNAAAVQFEVDVSNITGATADFGLLPSGVTLAFGAGVYTISGITTVAQYDSVKAPTITVPELFFGSIVVEAAIKYLEDGVAKQQSWEYGLYKPIANLTSTASLSCSANYSIFQSVGMPCTATLECELEDINLVSVATLSSQSKVTYRSPAAVLPVIGSVDLDPTVLPLPSSPQVSVANPNAFGTDEDDQYGTSVDNNGTYFISGAPFEDETDNILSGKAYVHNVSNGNLVYTFDNPNAHGDPLGDNFGYSVGISANYAVVGARFESDGNNSNSGKAYVYDLSDGSLERTLHMPFDLPPANFGSSCAISDTKVIVGAPGADGNGGRAFIFTRSTGSLATTITSLGSNTQTGSSVDIEPGGNYVVGAKGGTAGGKAFFYNGAGTYTLTNPNSPTFDEYGWDVCISSDYVAVVAYNHACYVYDTNTGNLQYTYTLISPVSCDIDENNKLTVGGTTETRVYDLDDGGKVVQKMTNPNADTTDTNDLFANSVGMANSATKLTVVVGAPREDATNNNAGYAYVYDFGDV